VRPRPLAVALKVAVSPATTAAPSGSETTASEPTTDGLAETTSPELSTPTQRLELGQEMAVMVAPGTVSTLGVSANEPLVEGVELTATSFPSEASQ
jgi:hypothetical protein